MILFSDNDYHKNGKAYIGGMDYFLKEVMMEKNVVTGKWNPQPPKLFLEDSSTDLEELANFPQIT